MFNHFDLVATQLQRVESFRPFNALKKIFLVVTQLQLVEQCRVSMDVLLKRSTYTHIDFEQDVKRDNNSSILTRCSGEMGRRI